MRLERDLLDRIDQWRRSGTGSLSRTEAVRRLLEAGLAQKDASRSLHLSGADKLVVMMLADIIKQMRIKTDISAELVQKAILGGHYWAFPQEMRGIFHGHADAPDSAAFVARVLDMWTFIEEALEGLDPADRSRVGAAAQAGPFGAGIRFAGFGGKQETDCLNIARFMVFDLGRFRRFGEGHGNLDAHRPMSGIYGAMLDAFEPMREHLVGRGLSAGELLEILGAAGGASA